MTLSLPLTTRFTLGPTITDQQRAFLDAHGFLVFSRVASADELGMMTDELDRLGRQWTAEGRRRVLGLPLLVGRGLDGGPLMHRYPYVSVFSRPIHAFVRAPRFAPVRALLGPGSRVGDDERFGVLVKVYTNHEGSRHRRLGWHTDELTEVLHLRIPQRYLNVGLHFDHCPRDNGGLRVIPGSHRQGPLALALRKPYFVSHAIDPDELAIETEPGDLTVHDSRIWHRAQQSWRRGAASLRRVMYVPYVNEPAQPRTEQSPPSLFHRLEPYIDRASDRLSPP